MYEGRNAQLFHPTTAVITWMSNPAQPSFVWQIYHYDLEPMSSYFAVMHASELVHIQFNEATGHVQVINNKPDAMANLRAHVAVYNLDGSLAYEHETQISAAPDVATDLGPIDFPAAVSPVHFIKLDLRECDRPTDLDQFLLARCRPPIPTTLYALNQLPMVTLTATVRSDERSHSGATQAARHAAQSQQQHRADGASATAAQIGRARAAGFLQRQLCLACARRIQVHRDGSGGKRTQGRSCSGCGRWMECDGGAGFVPWRMRSSPTSTHNPIAGPQPACRSQLPACAERWCRHQQKGPQPSKLRAFCVV